MLDLEIMDRVTLDNNEKYIVANTLEKDSKKYILLVNEKKDTDVLVAYQEGNAIISVEDYNKAMTLLSIFNPNKIIKMISNEDNIE